MERKRTELYYLDKVYDGHYALKADGTVSDVREKETYKTEYVPSRVPGLMRESRQVKVHVEEYGDEYKSLRDLAASQDKIYSTEYKKSYQIDESELIYTPAEVVETMRRWQSELSERVNCDKVTEAAQSMIATDEQLQNEQVPCRNCTEEQYACRESGWSRKFWKYPMIDIGGGQQNLVPFDVAKAISLSPDALEVEEIYMDDHQELSYVKRFILDMSKISAAYAGGETSEYLTINKSDRLAGARIAVDTGFWAENPDKFHASNYTRFYGDIQSNEDVVNSMQNIVTRGGERVEIADYDKVLSRVRADLGRRGLALTWNWQYQGMGETSAFVNLVKEDDITKGIFISNEVDTRMMIDSVYDRVIRHQKEARKSRPVYDDIDEDK